MSTGNNRRKIMLIFIDVGAFIFIYLSSALIASISGSSMTISPIAYLNNAFIFLVVLFLSRFAARVYSNVWRYANSKAYLQMVIADLVGGILATVITWNINVIYFGIWQSASLVAMFNVSTLTFRFAYQQYYRHQNISLNDLNKIGVAIVGAGQIGSLLADELTLTASSHYRPVCFIDTNPDKIGSRVSGLKVYAADEEVIEILKTMPVQEIFIALPSIDGEEARKLFDFYKRTGCKVKLYDFAFKDNFDGMDTKKRVIREIRIEDLLFRDSIKINSLEHCTFYHGKVILVTGGGGSIGSELCRQIAKCNPKQLILLDIYENNVYDIQQELINQYGDALNLAAEIGSIRDRARLEGVFAYYRPEIVFHAAAHKHVPLMEHSSCDAIKNNIFGTYNTADMAEKYGALKFIMISTDKAVNPTNIMGATKRMCEMIIQCRTDSKTSFAAVRFGNVLGSNGSVIPLFKKHIDNGGPITITDKRIVRYFMTIPEASQMVMQAGAMAGSGELFVLDMGKPVKILDLAENMIRLSGLVPYQDIDIIEIGLRPGEKLYEELLIKTDCLNKTANDMIFIEREPHLSRMEVEAKLSILRDAVKVAEKTIESSAIKQAMKSVVSTYCDPDEVNCTVPVDF